MSIPSWLPWPTYRVLVRYRMWRNSASELNRRVDVENALLRAAKSGAGLTPEQCRELGMRLGSIA